MRGPAATMLFVATIASLGACTLLVSVDGLSGGGPSDEAGPSGDAGRGFDAGDAARPGQDAAGSSPCLSTHFFCDDFDTGGSDLATRWDDLRTTAGPLELDSTRSVSAPRSLRMNVRPTTGQKESVLERRVPLRDGTARVELDLYVARPSGSYKELDPIGLQLDPPPTGFDFQGVYLVLRPGETFLQYFAEKTGSGTNGDAQGAMSDIGTDRWHHVVFTVSYSGARKATLTIDGEVATVTLPDSSPTTMQLQLGAPYTNDTSLDWAVNFDNVVVDTP